MLEVLGGADDELEEVRDALVEDFDTLVDGCDALVDGCDAVEDGTAVDELELGSPGRPETAITSVG